MSKRILSILFLMFSQNIFSQTCPSQPIITSTDLVNALNNAISGDVICLTADIDVSSLSLPLIVRSGVTLQGTYDLLSEPNGIGATSAHGTTITSTKRVDYNLVNSNLQDLFVFELLPGSIDTPTTIRNIRLIGPTWNWIDYNNSNLNNNTNFLNGGIYIDDSGGASNYSVSHNEIFGFTFAGVFSRRAATNVKVDHCYIHHIKGICSPGIGYANWFQSSSQNPSDVLLENNLYDDCKEAIDGQSGIKNLSINNCTLTQFFYGGIGSHAGSLSFQHDSSSTSGCQIFDSNQNLPYPADVAFNLGEVCGGNKLLNGVVSHFKLETNGSRGGLCGFPYPYSMPVSTNTNYFNLACSTPTVLASNGVKIINTNSVGDLNDGGWTGIQLGFNFNFLGVNYGDCSISTNGFIQFGPTLRLQDTTAAIGNNLMLTNFIALCLTNLDFSKSNSGTIQYCTSGTPGNRIFEVEWVNGQYRNDTIQNINISGSVTGHIKIFEQDSSIEIHLHDQTINTLTQENSINEILGFENSSATGLYMENSKSLSYTTARVYKFGHPQFYTLTLSGNTIVAPEATGYPNNLGGFATVSHYYIESCLWNGDTCIKYNTSTGAAFNNSFNYSPGNSVAVGCPQPPELSLSLKNFSNQLLPKTNINPTYTPLGYNYISSGTPIKISIAPGTLGSQYNTYIIRPNPDHGNPVVNNSSGNNNFFDDQMVLGPQAGSVTENYSLYEASKPGLHGIDVLAVASDNSTNPFWNKYNSSAWQHIPLISVPPYSDPHLIFYIKDSYYNQYLANGTQPYPNTGVLKTVELNGHRIWDEDIAEGGDGWERVDIPLINNPSINSEWIIPSTQGKNLLSFSINFKAGVSVSTSIVQGVSVWIDDVYINRYSNVEGKNLIIDGDLENESCGKLPTSGENCGGSSCLNHCTWFKNDINAPGYPVVCTYTTSSVQQDGYYNDGNILTRVSAPNSTTNIIRGQAFLGARERKSGQASIVINLPRLDNPSVQCTTYSTPVISAPPNLLPIQVPFNSSSILFPGLVSAFTQFEFPRCGSYSKDLEDQFTTPLNVVSGIIQADQYNLNKSLTITPGATLQINNSDLAIGPAVSITVSVGSTLILNNTTLSACGDEMWRGIILQAGAHLSTVGSTFSDAEKAVYLRTAAPGNQTNVHIEQCTFNSNYIGIDMEPTANQTFNDIQMLVTQSHFDSPYQLKNSPNYVTSSQSYAGINLNNWNGIIGKYGSTQPNLFEHQNIGIRSIQCVLTVWASKFINIHADHFYVTPNAGTGIYAEGNDPGYLLKQYGFGQAFAPSFEECDLGIHSNGVASIIVGNNMQTVDRGILLSNLADGSTSNITVNTIHCNYEGIVSQFPNTIRQLTINADSIFVNNTSGDTNDGIGIGSYDVNGNVSSIAIVGNVIKMENATIGIHTNGASGNIVANNKVNMIDDAVEGAIAFNAVSGNSNIISCNNAYGNTVSHFQNQHGYTFSMSTENEISCNNASDIYYGFEFDDDCHMMDKFIANSMSNHFIGLNFNQDGIIGEQWHRGNSWTGNFSSGNEAVDPNSGASFFYVNPNDPSIYIPANPDPNNGWFFFDNSANAFQCSAQKVCGSKEAGSGKNSTLEKMIADGSYTPSDFPEESSWIARLLLFQKLMKEPTAINDSTLLAFYNYNLNSNIDKINQIRNETGNLDVKSASDSTILSNNDSLLQMTMIMIENCAKSFDQGNISEQQYNSTLDNLKQAIENINNSSKQIAAGLKVQRETQAENIRTFNNLISSTKVYELNEKFVNDLYLRTVAKRIMEIPASDQPQLLSIAHECPFVGGQAVYKARALYRLVNPIEAYDDYPLCHSLGLLRKRPTEDSPLLQSVVYPNPSSHSATLAYSLNEDTQTTLNIYDFSLKLIASQSLKNSERQEKLNLESYNQGLYLYIIIQNNYVISKGKFSVVR